MSMVKHVIAIVPGLCKYISTGQYICVLRNKSNLPDSSYFLTFIVTTRLNIR